jgi:hypothetical protein
VARVTVADLQRGMGGPLHGPEGAGGPERAPGRRKFVGRGSGNVPLLERKKIRFSPIKGQKVRPTDSNIANNI